MDSSIQIKKKEKGINVIPASCTLITSKLDEGYEALRNANVSLDVVAIEPDMQAIDLAWITRRARNVVVQVKDKFLLFSHFLKKDKGQFFSKLNRQVIYDTLRDDLLRDFIEISDPVEDRTVCYVCVMEPCGVPTYCVGDPQTVSCHYTGVKKDYRLCELPKGGPIPVDADLKEWYIKTRDGGADVKATLFAKDAIVAASSYSFSVAAQILVEHHIFEKNECDDWVILDPEGRVGVDFDQHEYTGLEGDTVTDLEMQVVLSSMLKKYAPEKKIMLFVPEKFWGPILYDAMVQVSGVAVLYGEYDYFYAGGLHPEPGFQRLHGRQAMVGYYELWGLKIVKVGTEQSWLNVDPDCYNMQYHVNDAEAYSTETALERTLPDAEMANTYKNKQCSKLAMDADGIENLVLCRTITQFQNAQVVNANSVRDYIYLESLRKRCKLSIDIYFSPLQRIIDKSFGLDYSNTQYTGVVLFADELIVVPSWLRMLKSEPNCNIEYVAEVGYVFWSNTPDALKVDYDFCDVRKKIVILPSERYSTELTCLYLRVDNGMPAPNRSAWRGETRTRFCIGMVYHEGEDDEVDHWSQSWFADEPLPLSAYDNHAMLSLLKFGSSLGDHTLVRVVMDYFFALRKAFVLHPHNAFVLEGYDDQ